MGKDKVGNEVDWGETQRGNERLDEETEASWKEVGGMAGNVRLEWES